MKLWKVKVIETGFVDQAAYLEQLRPAGVVVAPRRKEGIGMSFLEAMAMGKVVVAHNDATMNEYIRDGENGFLFDADSPCQIDMARVEEVHRRSRDELVRLHQAWVDSIPRILDFIEEAPACRPTLLKQMAIVLSYPLYLVEGAIARFCHH